MSELLKVTQLLQEVRKHINVSYYKTNAFKQIFDASKLTNLAIDDNFGESIYILFHFFQALLLQDTSKDESLKLCKKYIKISY